MNNISIIIGILVILSMLSGVAADNIVYFDPEIVYMDGVGTETVQVFLDSTDTIDTWGTEIVFDSNCINITNVEFSGSITPTYNGWGHFGNYIYLGGTDLNYMSGEDLLLATLTVECIDPLGCTSSLNFTGETGNERLIAGPPDNSPNYVTVYEATWISETDWLLQWTGSDTDGAKNITTKELQGAIHCWLENIEIRGGHILKTSDLQLVISLWLGFSN
jgi:hypothetical protein